MPDTLASPREASGLPPLSLRDAPAFIERQFPVGRLSAEAYKERKAGAGQTLTALGSYWKGRKPLILCRAVTLGCLLPATDDPITDLEVFLALMAMDDAAFGRRFDGGPSAFAKAFPAHAALTTEAAGRRVVWRKDLTLEQLQVRIAEAMATLPYSAEGRLKLGRRPEELDQTLTLPAPVWTKVNAHLGTTARRLPELVEQLGVARFGHRPKVADTFCGGGSIPFEAARIGCEVFASDLNPIACMLTWGAFNIIGASPERRMEIERAQRAVVDAVDAEITRLGIEHDAHGNRAKAYLYCLETRCPRTGWMVPMSPSWVISKTRRVVAVLVPNEAGKRYDIEVRTDASTADMSEAELGTVRNRRLVHPMNPAGVELSVIRGDHKGTDGENKNRLRPWKKSDFTPEPDDIWQERLYAIQWISRGKIGENRPDTFFSGVTEEDIVREKIVHDLVSSNLVEWQNKGYVSDMAIMHGDNTTQPIKERGWSYWHHLFGPRHILTLALLRSHSKGAEDFLCISSTLNFSSKLTRWAVGATGRPGVAPNGDFPAMVFSNQALNTLINYAQRAFFDLYGPYLVAGKYADVSGTGSVVTGDARHFTNATDLFITDPPYADAVNYHEITEFFIAWLRKNPPTPFDEWTWDSQRALAIKGRDEDFRRSMVDAYGAMTRCMPDNGMQVVMFTHQDAGVWADLAGILWAAGLRVTAAWNIVTETESALKEGNYVQGTVCLVLRKRVGTDNARRMEIEAEIEDEVKAQLKVLSRLDEGWTGETLYTDGDLTLAAYAAALRVVTGYGTIDRREVGADVFRPLKKGERTPLRELIAYASSVANRELVPQGFPKDAWRDLDPASRFYVRMLDMEAKGSVKVADFQSFAKSFAYADYASLMASTTANAAALAGAETLKGRALREPKLASQALFQVLFAVWKTLEKDDPKVGVSFFKTTPGLADYWTRRQRLADLASYVAVKTAATRPVESAAAALLAEAIKVDRV